MKIDLKTFLTLLFLGFVWGSAFILMKKGLVAFSPLQLASLRLVFAGSVAVFFFVKLYKGLKTKDWLFLAISGILGNLIPAYLFASAGKQIPSSLSGALNALTPIFALIFGVLLFKIPFKNKQIIGIFVGLIGALLLIFSKDIYNYIFHNPNENLSLKAEYLWPCGKVILAAVLYGMNVNIIKSKLGHLSAYSNSMVPLTFIAIPAFVIGMANNTYQTAIEPGSAIPLLFIIILGVLGSAVSLIVFNKLVKQTSALFAASVTYLIPFFAFMWGVIDGESIGLVHFAGMGLILGGITLTR